MSSDASPVDKRQRIRNTSFHDLAPICLGVVSACSRVSSRCDWVGIRHIIVSRSSITDTTSVRVNASTSQAANAS